MAMDQGETEEGHGLQSMKRGMSPVYSRSAG